MRAASTLGAILATAALAACASLPAPTPESSQSAGVAISIRNFAPIGMVWRRPDRVFFMRLEGEGEPPFTHGELLPSNYAKGGYVLLLNAEPGHYVAVASTRGQSALGGSEMTPVYSGSHTSVGVGISVGATDYTTYFSEELIELTKVTVEPGGIAYMGSFSVNQSVGLKDAGPTPLHFYRLMAPGHAEMNTVEMMLSGDYQYRGSLREALQGEVEQAKFRESVRNMLAGTGWEASSRAVGTRPLDPGEDAE